MASVSSLEPASSGSPIRTRHTNESLYKISLIGRTSHQITGAKLPSKRQVLQVLFYNMRFVKLSAKDSARLAVNAALIFWQQARIPTRYELRCAEQLIKIYEQWKNVQKTVAARRPDARKKAEDVFVEDLDDLFDIAHADALTLMKIDEDRQFLILQRQKGRPGCMAGVDMALFAQEKRTSERVEKQQARKRKYKETLQESGTSTIYLLLSARELVILNCALLFSYCRNDGIE